MEQAKKIRVLVVDDSAVMRKLLTELLGRSNDIEVVGTAADPYEGREKLVNLRPDVMTLDVDMPRMDGVTFLEKVMEHFPVRTVVVSAVTTEGSDTALKMLALGAIDIIPKPTLEGVGSLDAASSFLVQRVKEAMLARLPKKPEAKKPIRPAGPISSDVADRVIAIGSSTGGTEALKILLAGLPSNSPGIVIVQHMPPIFTHTYAQVLGRLTPFEVKEAQHGDRVYPGRVLIAPGNFHMELFRDATGYCVHLHQRPPLHGVRPAADYLLSSVAKQARQNAIGVVLTGMGRDGADGLLQMKQAGSYNIVQDEATSVVFGMPKEAIRCGAVHEVLAIDSMADGILRALKRVDRIRRPAA